jgi:hypothetical protein
VNLKDATMKVTTANGDEVELRPALETHPIGANGEAIPCLVIRALHPPGRPVAFRLVSPAVKHNSEQRYYRKADSCTAIFGPFTEADFRSQPAKLELISTHAVTTDASAALTLTPPRPSPGVRLEQDYKPQPAKAVDDR